MKTAAIKQYIFKIILDVVRIEASLMGYFWRRAPKTHRRVAVLEPCPTSKYSNGDEALIHGVCRFLSDAGHGTVDLLTFTEVNTPALPYNVRHGGSLYKSDHKILRKIFRYFYWPALFARYEHFYVIGADLIDGYYATSVSDQLFRLLDIAERAGTKTSLISCSFNESAPTEVVESMRRNLTRTRVHARDKYTAERLTKTLSRPIGHSADVAFGLLPQDTDNTAAVKAWVAQERTVGRHVIALNINAIPVAMKDPSRIDVYFARWATWIEQVTASGISIVLLAHDYRGVYSDEMAANSVVKQVAPTHQRYCLIPSQRLNAAEIKSAVDSCDFVVTGRMHLAIAAMGAGIPVVAYAYQSKFEGILRLFGLEEYVRPIEGVFADVRQEAEFALALQTQSHLLRARCMERVESVVEMARNNVVKL